MLRVRRRLRKTRPQSRNSIHPQPGSRPHRRRRAAETDPDSGYLAKLSSQGTALLFASYGALAPQIALDPAGNVYIDGCFPDVEPTPGTFQTTQKKGHWRLAKRNRHRDLHLRSRCPCDKRYAEEFAGRGTSGEPVTLTATVKATDSTATGTATFLHGGDVIGAAPLVNGVATLTTATLPDGAHSISVEYGGSATEAVSGSPAVVVVVNP